MKVDKDRHDYGGIIMSQRHEIYAQSRIMLNETTGRVIFRCTETRVTKSYLQRPKKLFVKYLYQVLQKIARCRDCCFDMSCVQEA